MQQTQEFKFRNMIEPISLQSYLKFIFVVATLGDGIVAATRWRNHLVILSEKTSTLKDFGSVQIPGPTDRFTSVRFAWIPLLATERALTKSQGFGNRFLHFCILDIFQALSSLAISA